MVSDHFSDDEVEKLFGKFRVKIGLMRQVFKPRDLGRFAGKIGRGKVVFGLETANRLSVLEPLAKGIDKDRVKPVNRLAVLFQKRGGAGALISQGASLSV